MYHPTYEDAKRAYEDAKRRGHERWWKKRKADALKKGITLNKAEEFARVGIPLHEPKRMRKVGPRLAAAGSRKVPSYFEPTRKTKTGDLLTAYFKTLLKNGDKFEKRIPASDLKNNFKMLKKDQLGRLPQKGYVPVTRIPKTNTNAYKKATDKTFSKLADELRYVGFITELRRELARLRRGQGRAAPKQSRPVRPKKRRASGKAHLRITRPVLPMAATKSPARYPLALYNQGRADYFSRQMPQKSKGARKKPVTIVSMAQELD